ncbi:hypothetical protein [Mycobacterium intracellulare]|uniref:hypothetical protein n=1 Tax=Mycobacterium intracellulare TaxID=1767 RepID=UPI0011557E8E|nr:hypothetical protein [Mycobacterium intracellulare]MCA2231121.1 hypothetical protein [Mycobacterium intracellulare]
MGQANDDKVGDRQLGALLENASPLERLIRGHLYIEWALISLIETKLQFPDRVDLGRFTFPQKIELAAAHGFIRPENVPSYNKLNALRNKIAHRVDHQLAASDVAELANTLSSEIRKIFDERCKAESITENRWNDRLSWIIALLYVTIRKTREEYNAYLAEHDAVMVEAAQLLRDIRKERELKNGK